MKTMTCQQMGGPCETAIQGISADEMIANGAKHITDMVAGGDTTHQAALDMMEEARTNPASAAEWFVKFQADYNALPEQN